MSMCITFNTIVSFAIPLVGVDVPRAVLDGIAKVKNDVLRCSILQEEGYPCSEWF